MSRPTTQYELETVLAAIEKGYTKTGTATVLGVTWQTVDNYSKRWASVREALNNKRRELVDLGEVSLRRAIVAGEPYAVGLVLKTLGKDLGYTERQEISGPDGGPLDIKIREIVVELPGDE